MGFALKMRGVPKDEIDTRVREAARILGLTDSLKKKPRTLSGGQRQRVAMGRAIVRKPQAFLMDEPLSNLDAKLRVEMRAEIARIQRDLGRDDVYVTHDQTEAMTMGDRVAVMRNGLLQQVAAPKVLYERPRNLFVAEFIGSPAMNLVMADVAARGRRRLGAVRRPSPPARARDAREAPGALRASKGGRSSSGSGPRTWRTPRCYARRIPTGACPSSATSARTWARRCTSTSTCPAEPVTTKEVVEALVVEAPRTRRRGWRPSARAAAASPSSPGSSERRRPASASRSSSRSTSRAFTSSIPRPVSGSTEATS